MTRKDLKKRLRARGAYRPEHELLLDTAIDETIQIIWDFHDWSWKIGMDTFTASAATQELDSDVDSILELTYGANNRRVEHVPFHRLRELYDNQSRAGDEVYYYTLYSTTPEQLTIEMVPTPSGDTFTYRYRRKLTYGDLGSIPSKLHPLVLLGAGIYLASGDLASSASFQSGMAAARERDKPIVVRRWNMGLDQTIANRVNSRNTLMSGGSGQDTTKPTN